jgi:uncharacterized protein
LPAPAATPHLPYPVPIEAYGKGGFRFASMSHRGSLLCLPDGIWAWPVETPQGITEGTLAMVLTCAGNLDLFVLGTGRDPWNLPQALRDHLRGHSLKCETMTTAAAIRTYNVLLAEGRRVGAGLIAVD